MALSLAELTKPVTKDEELTTLLELATLAAFPATAWQPGAVPRTLLELEAETLSKLSELVAAIAKGGLLDQAEGDWLTLLAASVFDVTRLAAIKTRGTVEVVCAVGAGPYTIQFGQLVATDASGKRFRNTNVVPANLTSGGTKYFDFEAEVGGAAYNIPANTLTILLTPLAGVTINNPVTPPETTWLTVTGADEETDAQLRARCKAKWATIGSGSTADTYVYWATTASPEVKRVKVLEHNNLGVSADGHVTLYLAGDGGPVSGGAVDLVAEYVAPRRPLCISEHIASASGLAITITATVYVQAAYLAAAQGAMPGVFTTFARSLTIAGTVYRSAIIEQLMSPTGVENTVLAAPASDTVLAFNQVATFTLDLTWVSV
jgi:uncharacterized phage protein gp47/JayE